MSDIMLTCILEKEEYVILHSLIKTSQSISNIYEKLKQLELYDKKNCAEYRKYLDYLKVAKEVEKEIIEGMHLDASKCLAIIQYLKNIDTKVALEDMDYIFHSNSKTLYLRRVLNLIEEKMHDDYDGMKKYDLSCMNCDELAMKEDEQLSRFETDYLDKLFIGRTIKKYIVYETRLMFLCLLNEYNENSMFKSPKKDIACIKYTCAFLNPHIEDELMENNFDIPKNVLVNSNLYAYLYNFTKEDYLELQDSYGYNHALTLINEILQYNDLYYLDSKNIWDVCVLKCMLRSYLLHLSDGSLMKLNAEYKKNLYQMAKDRIKHYVSERMINECFYNTCDDRNYQKILQLAK